MKKIIFILFIAFANINAFAQCSGGVNGGALSPAPASTYNTMTVAAGSYYTFTVSPGCMPTLDFTFCSNGGSASFDTQLTILDNTGAYAGGYNDDFCGLQSNIASWTAPAAGTYRILFSSYPCGSSGATATLAYHSITPASMTFTSSTCTQAVVTSVTKCDLDQQIIGIQVVVAGSCSPFSITQFLVNMNGTTSPVNDATKVHIYYTGTSSTFAASSEFFAGGTNPAAGTLTINGSQALVAGTNYFWVAYDVNPIATTGDVLDAQCTQFTCSGARVPTVTNPAGTRSIAICTVAPGAIGSEVLWLKSNAGTSTTTNNAAMGTWSDQSGNARNASSAVANNPIFKDNAANNLNFNPTISFNGTNQYLDAANNSFSVGPNMYSIYLVGVPNSYATPGKIFSAGNFGGTDDVLAADVRATNAFNHGWDNDDNIVNNQVTPAYPYLASCYYDNSTNKRNTFLQGTSIASSTPVGARTNNSTTCGIGRARNPNNEFYNGTIAEIVSYDATCHSQMQRYKVESYLAVKYGITLSHDYYSSGNTKVWNYALDASYNTNIIGVARDDNSALSQKQSKSTSVSSDILTIYIGPAKTTNQSANTGTFTAGDQSFFMSGSNNAAIVETTWPQTPVPAGICCRLLRQWLSQKTNFTNVDLKFEFDFTSVSGTIGPLVAADFRMLVDNDGNFSNASVIVPTSCTVAGFVVTLTVPASSFTAAQPYYTLGSIATTTPLPISLVNFSYECQNNFMQLNWTTASETNNDHFTIERASDNGNFVAIATVTGSGTTSQTHNYSWTDENPIPGNAYYRLTQTDFNGTTMQCAVIYTEPCLTGSTLLYPNPFSHTTSFYCDIETDADVHAEVYDMIGRSLFTLVDDRYLKAGAYRYDIDLSSYPNGVYLLRSVINGKSVTYKLVKE